MHAVQQVRFRPLTLVLLALIAGCGQAPSGTQGLVATPGPATPDSGGLGGDSFGRKDDAETGADATHEGSDADAAPTLPEGKPAVSAVGAKAVVGEDAQVACTLRDAQGQPVATEPGAFELVVAAPLTLTGPLTVTSTQTGAFPVACRLEAQPELAATPGEAVFVAGAMARIAASPEPAQVAAGAPSQVTCKTLDAFGNPSTKLAPVTADTPDGPAPATTVEAGELTVNDHAVSGKLVGTYEVRCQAVGSALQQVPATLTIVPGKPAFSKAKLQPDSAAAGTAVQVDCTGHDEFGNAVEPPLQGWQIQAPADCQIAGTSAQCTQAGAHAVACSHADVPEAVPAELTIVPGPPAQMTLQLQPALPNYQTWQNITVVGAGLDSYGNAIADIPLQGIALTPAQGVAAIDPPNQTFSLAEDGKYTLTAAAKTAPQVQASVQLQVDSHGPLVDVSYPKRGATLPYTPTVKVTFSALDELSALGKVKVNGKDVAPGSGLGIQATIAAKHGLNLVTIEAEDVWGHPRKVVQSFYAAEKYRGVAQAQPSQGYVAPGLDAWLGQPAIDSGVHVHSKPRDLATVFEIVLKNVNFSALLGSGFPVDSNGLKGTVTIKSLTFGDPSKNGGYPQVKLTAVDGGLHLDGTIHKVKATVNVSGKQWGFVPVNVDATLTATSMAVDGVLKISVSTAGKASVTLQGVQIELNNLDVNIDNAWGFLVNWLIDLFNGTVTNLLEGMLEKALASSLAAPLGKAIDAFALNQTFTVPGFLGGKPAPVAIASTLHALQFSGPKSGAQGGARIALKAAVGSKKANTPAILGAVARNGCLTSTDPSATHKKASAIELALHTDVVNELLAALWQTGALTFHLDQSLFASVDLGGYGVTDLKIKTNLLLPPLVSDCTPGGKAEMQIGDLGLDVTMQLGGVPVAAKVYVSAAAAVAIAVVPGVNGPELSLSLGKPHLLETDADQVLVEGKGTGTALANLLEQVVLPFAASKVMEGLGGTLASFPLPELDLSLITASIPKGTVLALEPQQAWHGPAWLNAAGKVKK